MYLVVTVILKNLACRFKYQPQMFSGDTRHIDKE